MNATTEKSGPSRAERVIGKAIVALVVLVGSLLVLTSSGCGALGS